MSTPAVNHKRRLTLEQLRFSNSFARLAGHFHSRVLPTPLGNPYLIHFNPLAAALIDLDPAEAERTDFPVIFNGGKLLQGSEPLAMLYAGHQFGHYVKQPGAGQTPYSRAGDGRAVLR